MVTAVADVLAGIALSGFFTTGLFDVSHILPVLLLSISTALLYGGGVVFNDVFDADLDRVERPERSIPSGLISYKEAFTLGTILLLAGIVFAFTVNVVSGLLSLAITICALIYNKWGKHQSVIGPVNMGLCRGLNLLLGISIVSGSVSNWWFIAIVPIIYISSITMISRGEVHGSSSKPLYGASFLYALVIALILYFSFTKNTLIFALIFLLPFAWMIFKPLLKAIKMPSGPNIGKSVKAGVIALIVMDAAWTAASGSFYVAIIVALLLPISFWLARMFAVT
ncbi:MAG: hypothetical protein JWN56_1977 [Sphingobacteriales bacterium]|nr:hypothetical protein [Sphingobacteriales bacterium]